MNHFYLAKKSCFLSSILNIVGSISLILLISVISYYHFNVLGGEGSSQYSQLLGTNSNDASSSTSSNSPHFASSYINSYGYATFFGVNLLGSLTYWHIVFFLYIVSIFCFSIKTVLCVFNTISAIKAKSIAYAHAALLDLFLPLVGGIMSFIVCRDNEKIIEYKAVLPLQWVRYRIKNAFYQIFSDVNMKNL